MKPGPILRWICCKYCIVHSHFVQREVALLNRYAYVCQEGLTGFTEAFSCHNRARNCIAYGSRNQWIHCSYDSVLIKFQLLIRHSEIVSKNRLSSSIKNRIIGFNWLVEPIYSDELNVSRLECTAAMELDRKRGVKNLSIPRPETILSF